MTNLTPQEENQFSNFLTRESLQQSLLALYAVSCVKDGFGFLDDSEKEILKKLEALVKP